MSEYNMTYVIKYVANRINGKRDEITITINDRKFTTSKAFAFGLSGKIRNANTLNRTKCHFKFNIPIKNSQTYTVFEKK